MTVWGVFFFAFFFRATPVSHMEVPGLGGWWQFYLKGTQIRTNQMKKYKQGIWGGSPVYGFCVPSHGDSGTSPTRKLIWALYAGFLLGCHSISCMDWIVNNMNKRHLQPPSPWRSSYCCVAQGPQPSNHGWQFWQGHPPFWDWLHAHQESPH